MIHIGRVNEDSQDGSIRSKAAAIRTLEWACAAARKIECGDDALLVPQKAMGREGIIKVESRDLPIRVDCEAMRSLTAPVPAPGASNVVMTPFLSLRKP